RENTLPLEIWSRLRRGMTPEINAVSTIIFAFSLLMMLVWYRLRVGGESAEPIAEPMQSLPRS
ncbi:MAG: ABC transporter permease, partial [Terriglobales bacterium]